MRTRKVHRFPKNKHWVSLELKTPLKGKKKVFRCGDKNELRRVQRRLKREIRKCKDIDRRKLEEPFQGKTQETSGEAKK